MRGEYETMPWVHRKEVTQYSIAFLLLLPVRGGERRQGGEGVSMKWKGCSGVDPYHDGHINEYRHSEAASS
ncbi:hypothetical protein SERLA73DRAFT_175275 [Serpula lacrymans var. lacrymans S7.3]|uniref:Uncharacterized protein n=1 Tax=Serpula lacrymans var. lacrymans (strain S7.3) TaxID=936435 RepID=F8PIQ4_SERL3|nr:hypothetical protein SERLA73DRAFT_175275 [Serpula lacrymans var. lacrymans S7.3]